MENDAFVGPPTITVSRVVEEDDIVVAEGTVEVARRGGGILRLVFCDVFTMQTAKIRRLVSYLVELR